MRHSTTIHILCSVIAAFIVNGCYTQLMNPQDYLKIRTQQPSAPIANNSYSINYNQSCTSCHSVAELNERAEELLSYGVQTVHDGILLTDRPWLDEEPGTIFYGDPGPTYWPTPMYPTNPWWLPAPAVVIYGSGQNQGSTSTPKKKRADNPSHGNERNTEREQPSPTYTTPVPVTQSNPQPPVSTGTSSPVTIQQQPSPSQPAQSQSSGSRDSGSSSGSSAPKKKRSD